ncbi:MAG TPA: sensor histidine kinase [Solirubrobacteraceae bacterium]|nr:sensor histidine kinase [Solirubrobacteraceae bacterium]
MSVELTGRRGAVVRRTAPLVAALAALWILIWMLAGFHYFWPMWPMWAFAGIFALLIARGPLQQFFVAAVAFNVLWAMTGSHYYWAGWPMLGIGLALGAPRLITGRREQQLEERVDELSRTRRGALDVQATELRRIERDLHDGAQARLVALSMKLGRAEDRYAEQPEVSALLREAREDASAAIRELRELARGIAPPVLADRGLEAAVRSLADRTGMEVELHASLARRPTPAVEIAAYFVVAESLTNAAKHAANTRAEVRLDEHGGDLFVEVTDFGPGGADPSGSGLTGLRQRVEALDGQLQVTSPPGVGTQVEAVLPCGW